RPTRSARKAVEPAGVVSGGALGPCLAPAGHLELRHEVKEAGERGEREPRRKNVRAEADPGEGDRREERREAGGGESIKTLGQRRDRGAAGGLALGVNGRGGLRVGHRGSWLKTCGRFASRLRGFSRLLSAVPVRRLLHSLVEQHARRVAEFRAGLRD